MKKFFAICTLLLTTCSAADGPKYSELPATETKPGTNEAELIIYRSDELGLTTFSVAIDGEPACDIHNDSFIVKKVNKAQVTLKTTGTAKIGSSELFVPLNSGEVNYIKIGQKRGRRAVALMGGWAVKAAMGGSALMTGPVNMTITPAEEAKEDLASLKQETACK